MLSRSRCLSIFFTIFAASLILIAGEPVSNRAAAAPMAQAMHGLRGYYYVSNLEWHTDTSPTDFLNIFDVQVYFDDNDFGLPKPLKDAAATRVDEQIAFGKGKGFVPRDGKQFAWWATDYASPKDWPNPNDHPWDYTAAVIWKGYIHLPKAGTYYFATVKGPSAVYLNQARVVLNGASNSLLNSDAFTYAPDDVRDFIQNVSGKHAFSDRSNDAYVVPVTIDAPRDLPIEVAYNAWEKYTAGIDLFWVTPDSLRDANGKPIAQIVPSDALYVDPPGPIEQPVVRGANSTISPDHLYPPADGLTFTTLTIRLADENGQPVAGKHVHVSTLTGLNPLRDFTLVQPDKPTDENGNATFKVKTLKGDDLTFFATDVDDLVDVAQVAHVTIVQSSEDDFFPDTFAPYYDGHNFLVEPLPLVQGSPATIKFPLKNHGKNPVELTATFSVQDWNIGASDWQEVGKVEHIVIQPGETKEVVGTWTPQMTSSHICFKIEISGHYLAAAPEINVQLAGFIVGAKLFSATALGVHADQNIPSATRSRNLGPVQPSINPCDIAVEAGYYTDKHMIKRNPGESLLEYAKRTGGLYHAQYNNLKDLAPYWLGECMDWILQKPGNAAKVEAKVVAALRVQEEENDLRFILTESDRCMLEHCDPRYVSTLQGATKEITSQISTNRQIVNDPPDLGYRQLAVAPSDTAAGYKEAFRVSMERYQGAQAAGDSEWLARHFTAMQLYQKRIAEALRREADTLQKEADALPPDDAQTLLRLQAAQDAFLSALRRDGNLSPEMLKQMEADGIPDAEIQSIVKDWLAEKGSPPVKGLHTRLADTATEYRAEAADWDWIAAGSSNTGTTDTTSQSFEQSYTVANPHDKEETIDLFIRPVSIPPNWKLSIVSAEAQTGGPGAAPTVDPSKPLIREIEAGKHYAVTLPAKATIQVASVLTPVGKVGANTSVRWAVEGKIGNELIGGMMHELDVPYIIPDLQLPPVGSVSPSSAVPPVPGVTIFVIGGAIVVFLALIVFRRRVVRRRRRA